MIVPRIELHCEMAKGISTIPAPTILLLKLNAAPNIDNLDSLSFSSLASWMRVSILLGVVTSCFCGGLGAKNGDHVDVDDEEEDWEVDAVARDTDGDCDCGCGCGLFLLMVIWMFLLMLVLLKLLLLLVLVP